MIDWWWVLVAWCVAWPAGYFRGWVRARDMYAPRRYTKMGRR